jgi:membrane protein required for colicin V production
MDSNTLVAAVDIYDAVMLAVLIAATVFGAWKGMAWQITSLAAIIVSGMVAIQFSGPLAPLISDSEPWNRFIAMFILYMLTSFTIWVLFRFVAGIIDRVKLKEFDRQMGALFGLAKGVLFCVVITFFAVTLSENLRQTVLGSFSGRCIAVLIKNATPILPEEVTNVLGKYIEELDRRLDPDEPAGDGLLDRAEPDDGKSLDDLDPGKMLDDIGNDLGDRVDGKLDEAGQSLKEKAADLSEVVKDRFNGDGQ